MTSGAIFSVNAKNSQVKLISPGNSLDIIKDGAFRDYLIVENHKYNENSDDSFDKIYIIDNQGKEVKMLGDYSTDISEFIKKAD